MNTASVMSSLSRNSGGLFESVRRLHQCLAEISGVSVTVVGLQDEFTEADREAWLPLDVKAFATRWPQQFGYAPGMKQKVLQLDEDIVHTHGMWRYPSIVTRDWHRKTGRPYLVSPHGMLDPWALKNSAWKKKPAWFFYEREHIEEAACLRALCESEAQSMRSVGLINPICIIPNGIDLPQPGRKPESESLTSPVREGKMEKKVLLYLGRIHPKKGLLNLVRAWSQMGDSKEWVLAIAGWDQGGHEDELKRLATGAGMKWSDVRAVKSEGQKEKMDILFLGPQFNEAKIACYEKCDAFILPSLSEGLPMVVLEAWAHGKPVLMTPECNLPEGFAAKAAIGIRTDPESIREGLHQLFRASSADLRSMGDNGRDLVASRFTWPKIAAELKSVYDWVLGSSSKPSCVLIK